jgi:hypothetical protein
VRRIRDLGGQTDSDGPAATSRVPEPLPAPLWAQEEAVLIAERLAALVESRRSGSSAVGKPPEAAPERTAPTRSATESAGVVGARHSGRLLGNLLLTRGFLVESELRYALARQASTGGPIGQILVYLGLITDRDLVELLAEQLRMQVIDLTRIECDRAALSRLSKRDARRFAALPLRLVDGQMDVAIADPTDDDTVAELMGILGAPLRLFLATRADIDAAVDRYYS